NAPHSGAPTPPCRPMTEGCLQTGNHVSGRGNERQGQTKSRIEDRGSKIAKTPAAATTTPPVRSSILNPRSSIHPAKDSPSPSEREEGGSFAARFNNIAADCVGGPAHGQVQQPEWPGQRTGVVSAFLAASLADRRRGLRRHLRLATPSAHRHGVLLG